MIDLSEKSQKVLFFVVLFAPREIWNPSFARPIKLWNDAKKRRTQTSHAEKLACWLVPHLMHSYSYPSKNRTFLITFHLQKSVGEILESPIRGHTCWHLHRPHLFTWTVLHVAIQAAEFFLGFFRNKFWSTKKNTGTPPNGPPKKKKTPRYWKLTTLTIRTKLRPKICRKRPKRQTVWQKGRGVWVQHQSYGI